MTRAREIETCAHAKKRGKTTVWFLPTGTVVLCAKCSRTVVRTARVVMRKARTE